jgi:DNA-binding NarL/FixJ family response regulator
VIRVLVVDDHHVVRAGLTQLLDAAADLECVGAARNGREAVALAAEHGPDVVLMDLSMPDVDGIEATRRLLAEVADVRVVVLTSFSDRDRILAAIDAGAIGYLLKDAEPEEILRGIRAAARGESPLDPKAASQLLTRAVKRGPELSERELDVLRLVAEGLPNKLIARRLAISEKTVKSHLTSIFQRIDVTDRTQAALWAHRHGIVTASGSSGG